MRLQAVSFAVSTVHTRLTVTRRRPWCTQRSEQLETLPQWLENAVAAAGMTAYADFDFVGNKSVTANNEQEAADPPGNVH